MNNPWIGAPMAVVIALAFCASPFLMIWTMDWIDGEGPSPWYSIKQILGLIGEGVVWLAKSIVLYQSPSRRRRRESLRRYRRINELERDLGLDPSGEWPKGLL